MFLLLRGPYGVRQLRWRRGPTVQRLRRKRLGRHADAGMMRSFGFALCLLLALLPAVAQMPAPAPTEPRTLAILIIGDAHNEGMTNIEKRLTGDILERRQQRGIDSHTLPIIFYHMDKPSERRYCEQRLGIQADHLLVGAIVEHQNYVVKSVLFKIERVQLPEIAAEQLIDHAQALLEPGPAAVVTPTAPVSGEDSPGAFYAYERAIGPIEVQRAQMEKVASQGQTLPPPQWQQMLTQDVVPGLRDLLAMAEKVPQGSPEVMTLHGMFVEELRYQLKAAEARQQALQSSNDTERHLAENYDQLADMARTRYTTELQRLQLKYPPK
ncbi:MAG: hypothetical protein ACYCW6_27535 [Candidatus Xenobia bacterium]